MNDQYAALMAQMPHSWYRDGLLTGMHGAWLIFIVGIVLMSAFWIWFDERGAPHRQEATGESAAEALRQRFAQGEISEERLVVGGYWRPRAEERIFMFS